MSLPPEPYEQCAECKHYPAYHDQPGQKCRAWTDETVDSKCACAGWKKAATAPDAKGKQKGGGSNE